MAQLFLTKTWGFSPETHPVLGFSRKSGRDKYMNDASPGDWVVIAGTRNEPTVPGEQGRLLGMCRLGRQLVDAEEILDAIGTPISQQERDKHGRYKWPWGLPMIETRRFIPKPNTQEVLGSYLSGLSWAAYAMLIEKELGPEAVEKLWALSYQDCTVHDIPEINRERSFEDALEVSRRHGPSGPPPSHQRSGSTRTPGEGFAYAMRLEGGKLGAIKIGCTSDISSRISTLNSELHPNLTGCSWHLLLSQGFGTERHAYNFEQELINLMQDHLVDGEREVVVCSEDQLKDVWVDVFSGKSWAD